MNTFGLFAGLICLAIIALGFPLVIYGERFFGYACWPYMLGLGALFMTLSLLTGSNWVAVALGALGATLVWGSTELRDQAARAKLGWFPLNRRKFEVPFAATIQRWRAPHL